MINSQRKSTLLHCGLKHYKCSDMKTLYKNVGLKPYSYWHKRQYCRECWLETLQYKDNTVESAGYNRRQ